MDIKRSTLLKMRDVTVLLGVVIAVIIGALVTRSYWMPLLANITGHNPFAGSERAAVAGVNAFGTIDYHDSYKNWKSRLCSVSTKDGCDLMITLADTSHMWAKAVAANTVRTTRSTPVAMVDTNKEELRAGWKLNVTVAEASGEKQNEVYVVVVKDGNQWKFERFMLGPEIEKYTQKGKQ